MTGQLRSSLPRTWSSPGVRALLHGGGRHLFAQSPDQVKACCFCVPFCVHVQHLSSLHLRRLRQGETSCNNMQHAAFSLPAGGQMKRVKKNAVNNSAAVKPRLQTRGDWRNEVDQLCATTLEASECCVKKSDDPSCRQQAKGSGGRGRRL